jgi:hypothetical protein
MEYSLFVKEVQTMDVWNFEVMCSNCNVEASWNEVTNRIYGNSFAIHDILLVGYRWKDLNDAKNLEYLYGYFYNSLSSEKSKLDNNATSDNWNWFCHASVYGIIGARA